MERLVRFFVERGKAIAILPAFSLFISAVFLGRGWLEKIRKIRIKNFIMEIIF